MNIQLDDNYRITADSKQYILQEIRVAKEGKNAGEETYSTIGFYGKLSHLLKAYKEVSIRSSEATTMQEVLEIIKNIDKKIDEILKDN